MSVGLQFERSAEHLARWFKTGLDGARRPSRTERENRCMLHEIAVWSTVEAAPLSVGSSHIRLQRAATDRDQRQPSVIKRHRR